MGDLLKADLDNLHSLGGTLGGHADAIDALKVTATVTMPGSPIQAVADQVGPAVVKAFGVMGADIRRMGNVCTNAAKSYEEAQRTFTAQLNQYTRGE